MGNQNDTNEYGYNSYTKAETIVGDSNLNGRHFFITGCNTGIGWETVRVLYNAGATVTMACRNDEKMQKAKEKIEKSGNLIKIDGGSIRTLVLDLSSLAKVRESVENYRKNFEMVKIDTLILNAGVMDVKKGISEDGFEIHMSINHFGHSLLTFLLLPLMNDIEGNRIVVLSSKAHRFGIISFDDMDFRKRDYSGFKAYGQSKLSNIAFAQELNKRLKDKNMKIEVMAVHPGVIKTELGRDSFRVRLFYTFGSAFCKSIEQGAATTIFCALDKRLKGLGGAYYADCGRKTVKAGTLNAEITKRLFEVTEERIGMKFPFSDVDGDDLTRDDHQPKDNNEKEEVEGEDEEEEEIGEEEETSQTVISIEEENGSNEKSEEEEKKDDDDDDDDDEEEEEEEEKGEVKSVFESDGDLDDVVDESEGRKKKEEDSEEESDDDGMDDIIDEAESPRKKGEEEDEDEDDED